MGLLEGDTALITGAASGIGRGIAKALVAEGVRPVLSDVAVEAGRALAREINATFIRCRREIARVCLNPGT
jgi:3-oxoacyl-[acyl-carrier protein] reductase